MVTVSHAALRLLHYLRKGSYVYRKGSTPFRPAYCYYMAEGLEKQCDYELAELKVCGLIADVSMSWQDPRIQLTPLGRTAIVTAPAKAKG